MTASVKLALMMTVQFLIITVNYRMVAHRNFIGTALSEVALLWLGFTIFKRVQAAETREEQVGYIIGGTVGSFLGLLLT